MTATAADSVTKTSNRLILYSCLVRPAAPVGRQDQRTCSTQRLQSRHRHTTLSSSVSWSIFSRLVSWGKFQGGTAKQLHLYSILIILLILYKSCKIFREQKCKQYMMLCWIHVPLCQCRSLGHPPGCWSHIVSN